MGDDFSQEPLAGSIYALRSMAASHLCLGVRPIADPNKPELDPDPLKDGAPIEYQLCNTATTTQYWKHDKKRGLFFNAANTQFVLDVTDGNIAAGAMLRIKHCVDDCPELGYNAFSFNQGLVSNRDTSSMALVMAPTGGMEGLREGTVASLEVCAEGANAMATSENCGEKRYLLFELFPMLRVEESVEAENCAPYSGTRKEPEMAETRAEAQEQCSMDRQCVAYNWANADAEGWY